jgi:hypothetical protein
MSALKIPAVYMRGGTSKGVFFQVSALPSDPVLRDRQLLRVIGSPDPYGKHIDGMGGATSSTSKVVLVGKSARPGYDVDYWFGAVAIDAPVIDWSGNCGNLTSAVGPFAIAEGLVPAPADGIAIVRIWQANLGKLIIAHIPVQGGRAVEEGSFEIDGVTFPAAEIKLEYMEPGGVEGDTGGSMFPTGRMVDVLTVPGVGQVSVTLLNAGNPLIVVDAAALQLKGTELPSVINQDRALLARCELIRAHGAVAMGLAATAEEATAKRPHTPKLAFVSGPQAYRAAGGKMIAAEAIDLTARILSMGQLHHAMTGTGAIALGIAAAIPGTLVEQLARPERTKGELRIGHASGTVLAGADSELRDGEWVVTRAIMSRSARRLMEGWVFVPEE